MPEAAEVETEKLHEAIHEELEKEGGGLLRAVALSTALLAALAAIASLRAGSTVNEALRLETVATRLQAQASDQWAYYQAKSMKSAIADAQQSTLAALGKSKDQELDHRAERYADEEREAAIRARAYEAQRDEASHEAEHLMHQHHWFAYGVALFQVAIALGAVAALTRRRSVWIASLVVGVAGLVAAAASFGGGGAGGPGGGILMQLGRWIPWLR